MMYPLCGGVGCYLAAAESTVLATRSDVTTTFVVDNVIAASNAGVLLDEAAHGYIVWNGTDARQGVPGISLSGNGDLKSGRHRHRPPHRRAHRGCWTPRHPTAPR